MRLTLIALLLVQSLSPAFAGGSSAYKGSAPVSAPGVAAAPVSFAPASSVGVPQGGQHYTPLRYDRPDTRAEKRQAEALSLETGTAESVAENIERGVSSWNGAASRKEEGVIEKIKKAPTWAKVTAGVTVAAAITIGAFYHVAAGRNAVWEKSKSAVEAAMIEKARSQGDAETLDKIGETARARGARMQERIDRAKAQGSKNVDDSSHDSVTQAERYVAYDGITAARADLNENVVSKDARKRIGEETPSTWKDRLGSLEAEAAQKDFEGKLAVALDDNAAEIAREQQKANGIAGAITKYDEVVPALFGGHMKEQREKASGELEVFKKDEVLTESQLLASTNAAMRGRESERLYSKSGEYRQHRDHFDRLKELFDGKLHPAAQTARDIDSDLASVISHRSSERTYLALAAMNTHVAVTKYRTRTDSKGNSHTESYTVYEDHSGTYRLMAASAASSARASAEAASRGLEILRRQLVVLRNDKTLDVEQLIAALPEGFKVAPGGGNSAFGDWFLPPMWSLIGTAFNSGEEARSAFGPVLGAVQSVEKTIASRRDGESSWVEGKISESLTAQKARAR